MVSHRISARGIAGLACLAAVCATVLAVLPAGAARRTMPTVGRIAGAPLSGYAIGADVAPANFLRRWPDQPTGPALVRLLVRDHLTFVRLLDAPPKPEPALYRRLAHGGWRTVFDELDRAQIHAVLLLSGAYTPAGEPTGQVWAPEGSLRAGQPLAIPPQRQMSTARWVSDEAAIISQIRRQFRGQLPRALAGVEVANEPTVDAATRPALARALRVMRRDVRPLPVTIGGWRAPDPQTGRVLYNQPQTAGTVAPLVDFVSAHLYPDNAVKLPGGEPDRASIQVGTYLPYTLSFLRTVTRLADGKPVVVGEFGARSGLDPTVAEGPQGSPAHQAAVLRAVLKAMATLRSRGITGGTVWLLVPHEGVGQECDTFALICYQPKVTQPGLAVLTLAAGAAARRHDG